MLPTPYILPTRVNVEKRADGALLVTNPNPMRATFENVVVPIRMHAQTQPNKLWLCGKEGNEWIKVTYAQGYKIINSLAAFLSKYIGQGDIVGIVSPNSLTHAFLTYALPIIGAVPAPITPAYSLKAKDAGRLNDILGLLKAKAVFCEGEKFNHIPNWLENTVEYIFTKNVTTQNNKTIIIDNIEDTEKQFDIDAIDPQSLCKILLTSGSTGLPKAVGISHYNLTQNASQIKATFDPVKEKEMWPDGMIMINHLPWSHSLGGNAVLNMLTDSGDTLWIDDGSPTPEGIIKTIANIKEIKPNYHNTVPIGWSLLAEYLEKDAELANALFGNLVLMQYGGAALTQELYNRLQNVVRKVRGDIISVAAGYGATETGPTACTVHFPNDTMGLVGLPVPGVVLKLVPHNDKMEVRIKSPAILPYYVNNPEKTKEAFDDEGYYLLGDALKFYDPEHPEKGLKFDGRIAEEFKLGNGSFVQVGNLRTEIVNCAHGLVSDAVICGEGENEIGALLFLNAARCKIIIEEGNDIKSRLKEIYEAEFKGKSATRKITKFLILDGVPSIEDAEITDKGYVNQSRCRETRFEAVKDLYKNCGGTIVLNV
ncbi:AMP-binding protein [Pseudaquidulcibacter saccharophilus]|uniref:AMP-binding protein n=1 Tax=Pseudaquidulcibacter saccharophilus TaxID=2831900 RepID=UPI001EFF0F6E|nr:AMP-binding protein [Pseudaquidulcibacter saccharophilus]